MRTDFRRAAKLLLVQLLKPDINEQLVREVDYLPAENQVFKNQVESNGRRLKFTDEQRRLLVDKAKALGKRLFEVVTIVCPETILYWQKKIGNKGVFPVGIFCSRKVSFFRPFFVDEINVLLSE